MLKMKLALCEGRHQIPQAEDGAIFCNTLNPLDLSGMQTTVSSCLQGVDSVDLYVTGLSVALVEVINFCHANNVTLTLWHFNRETGDYYPQSVS